MANLTGARLAGAGKSDCILRGVAPLETAEFDQLTFLDNPKYLDALRKTRAGAAFIHPDRAGIAPSDLTLLLTPSPYRAYAVAAQAFHAESPPFPNIAASAAIDPSVQLGAGCQIEPNVVIGAGAELGQDCIVGANTAIGPGCVLGPGTRVGANVSLSHCLIGARAWIHPGVRIGQDGFGFAPDPKGHVKVPQLGRVIVGDDVEIGANTTIDRGAGPDTVIGAGTKIDNLVQIGHNVQVGRGCILVAQVGIAGSTRLGDFVMIGGQTAVAGHLTIGTGARIAARSGVMRDVAPGEVVCGSPAVPIREHHRQALLLHRMAAKEKHD